MEMGSREPGMRLQQFAGRKAKLLAAEGVVLEAHFAHALRRIQIAPVDDQFARHDFSGAIPIELAKNIPLGANQRGIGVLQSLRSEERRVGKECRSRWSPYH